MFKDYSFVFDIDGTLCPIKKKDERYEDLVGRVHAFRTF